MTTLQVAQGLVKSDHNFIALTNPVLAFTANSSGVYSIYGFLKLNDSNEVVSSLNGDSIENMLKAMNSSDEYKDIEVLSHDDFVVKDQGQYCIGIATQIKKSRYCHMFETLPPCDQVREMDVHSFRYGGCVAYDLYMYFFRLGNHYFEMVNHLGADLNAMIEICRQVEVVDIPGED